MPSSDIVETSSQFSTFKDCLAKRILSTWDLPMDGSEGSAGDSLDDFTSYLALEVWPSLPKSIRDATYESLSSDEELREMRSDAFSIPVNTIPVPVSFSDTLVSYSLFEDADDCIRFLRKVLSDYLIEATAPPPVWKNTRGEECEICERSGVKLTYHHLIPKSVHAKVLKRRWQPMSMLGSVAWLCRPCHSAVHHVASNEDLARFFHTVDLLLEREDIQEWKKYASKQK